MKECYEAPEMEIIVFEADVITVNSSQTPRQLPIKRREELA